MTQQSFLSEILARITGAGRSRTLATLILDPVTAQSIGAGSAKFSVNSYTASGVFMSGTIFAPEGDQAIAASFKDCL